MSHVMLVDDSVEALTILSELLSAYGLHFARNGEEALRILELIPSPDLILLDVVMPGISGYDVCEKLKSDARHQGTPIIFITAMGDAESETRGLELGAVDYITKPFIAAVVKARIATHLSLKAAREELANQNHVLEARVLERTSALQSALEQVRQGSLETVLRLSRAAELRDESTGEHILRMSRYSAVVAKAYGFSDKDVETLLYSAPMHDIGKIGIPDHILTKTGKLTPEEWTCMKTHTLIGAKILSGSHSEIIKLAEVVALTHHEKWDGSGYPNGLRGEDIPVPGRVVAVADVFDALTSRRTYKDAFKLDQAFEIIHEGRGKHFEPGVVDAFFKTRDEILRVKRELTQTLAHA